MGCRAARGAPWGPQDQAVGSCGAHVELHLPGAAESPPDAVRVSAQTRPVPGGRHRPPEGESRGGRGTSRLSSGSRGHLACLPPQGHREPPSHAHPLQLRPPCLPGAPRGRVPSGMTTGPSARAGSCRALNPVSGREEQVLRRTW